MTGVWEAIAYQARVSPDAIALEDPSRKVPYRTVVADAEDLCREFAARGLLQARMVALSLPRGYLSVISMLAALRLGLPATHLANRLLKGEHASLCGRLGFTHLVTSQRDEQLQGLQQVVLDERWRDVRVSDPDTPVPDACFDPSAPAWVTFSSGTTGTPKGVVFSGEAFAARVEDCIRYYDMSGLARVFSVIGPSAGPGLMWMLTCLASGGRFILPQYKAGEFFDMLRDTGTTHLLASPNELSRIVTSWPQPLGTLRHLEAAGGEFMPTLARRVRARVTPHVYFQYGATEVGVVAHAKISRRVVESSGVGYVRPGALVEVVDEQGNAVPAGTPGHLRLRSRSMPLGRLLEGGAISPADHWFIPGDIGVLEADGLLRVIGREDNLVNLGGLKFSPAAMEEQLRDDPAVQDAAFFMVTSRGGQRLAWLALVVPASFDAEAAVGRLKRPAGFVISGVLCLPAIPRTDNGKVLVRELASMVPPEAIAAAVSPPARQ